MKTLQTLVLMSLNQGDGLEVDYADVKSEYEPSGSNSNSDIEEVPSRSRKRKIAPNSESESREKFPPKSPAM